ncbi:hypothetical protein [Teredinibacter purpureus]|uniref:hypothetical protein n=1 Tax=Teredinibacter purpureus TaxID=2731756 RepID=UPI0005F787A1|nr:hypothetical protein [Teredinibacter purpureus]
MNKYLSVFLVFLIVGISGCCAPIPWSAWNYETTFEFDGYPSPWNMPDVEQFSGLYVDGVFMNIFVKAHNETTNSGSSPYRIIITATENTIENKSIVFHSVKVTDSQGGKYNFQPITIDNAAKKTGEVDFPVARTLDPIKYHNPSPAVKKSRRASLWSDDNIRLGPDNGSVLIVTLDVEVIRADGNERKIVNFKFMPNRESGVLQCLTA